MRVHLKDEFHSLAIPAIQLTREGKVGVPAQSNAPRMPAHQFDRLIDPRHTTFMTDHVAGTIHQGEQLARVRQGYEQRRIPQDAFVGERHPTFALAVGPRDRAVGINESFGEKTAAVFSKPLRAPCASLPSTPGSHFHQSAA